MVLTRRRLSGLLFVCLALLLVHYLASLISSAPPRVKYVCASSSASGLTTRSLHTSSSPSPAPPTVAVCFYGRARSLRDDAYLSIKKYLLHRLDEQGFRKEVFLHTYFDDEEDEPARKGCQLLHPVACQEEDESKVDATIDVQAYLKHTNSSGSSDVIELVRQLRSVHRCWDLVEKHINDTGKPYRYVMLARSDARYAAPGLPHLDSFCLSEECRLEVGGWRRRLGVAYEDRFVVGVPEVVKLWATRDELALFYVDHYQRGLDGETFSRWSLLWHDVEYVPFPFCFERIRANGTAEPEDLKRCTSRPGKDHRPPPVMRILPGTGEAFFAEEEELPEPQVQSTETSPILGGVVKATSTKRRAERKGSPRRSKSTSYLINST